MKTNPVKQLINQKYIPALALEALKSRDYPEAIRTCRSYLNEQPDCLSAKIILARSLFLNGQTDEAENRFYGILKADPENMVALKFIGDIKFGEGDETTAMEYYNRILKIEPFTTGLSSPYSPPQSERTRVINLKRKAEEVIEDPVGRLPFKTETMGDLLLKQGHPRLALAIFKELAEKTGNSRLREKFEKTKIALNGGKDSDV
jgi:tetratricopeptide (TPR) repeat protein